MYIHQGFFGIAIRAAELDGRKGVEKKRWETCDVFAFGYHAKPRIVNFYAQKVHFDISMINISVKKR
jgi:hypothetical protein